MTNVSPQGTLPQLSRPSILGIWRLGRLIHTGRSAELYLAQPADAGRSPRWDYVLKRAIGIQDNANNLQQIAQFMTACHSVSHPNLVPVLDGSKSGASPYLVMPRLEGTTMQELLDATIKPLPVVLWLVRQTAQSLTAMHHAGWVHGDVCPSNIMVAPSGHVTVIDLGFATKIHGVSQRQFRSTPEYAAPEVLNGQTAALPSTDVFALGRILWKWLTRIEPVSECVLEPIAELVEQMVTTDPQDRPTIDYVKRTLLRFEMETLGTHIGPSHRRAA